MDASSPALRPFCPPKKRSKRSCRSSGSGPIHAALRRRPEQLSAITPDLTRDLGDTGALGFAPLFGTRCKRRNISPCTRLVERPFIGHPRCARPRTLLFKGELESDCQSQGAAPPAQCVSRDGLRFLCPGPLICKVGTEPVPPCKVFVGF